MLRREKTIYDSRIFVTSSAARHADRSILRSRLSAWRLWSLPPRVRALLVAVELAAVCLLTVDIVIHGVPRGLSVWLTAGALVVLSGVHAEISLRAERLRRRIAETRYIDLSSVWTFAGALLLPPLPAACTVIVSYTHLYFRVFRPAGTPPHRQFYSTSTVVLAVYLVAAVRLGFDGSNSWFAIVEIAACLAVYTGTNMLLVVSVIRLAQPGSRFLAILAGGEIALETATLSLGAIVAYAVMPDHLPLVALLIPALVLMEQTTLIRQLETRAATDAKTGLLNAEGWRSQALQLLDAAERDRSNVGVLILDLDYFKEVNDRYGHLVGDAVLRAVAEVIEAEIRDRDAAGRFGGEEFVIALAGVRVPADRDGGAVRDVGERIRRRIEALTVEVDGDEAPPMQVSALTASIGAAVYPEAGRDLDVLLAAADGALYAAKNAGRNRVLVSHGPTPPPPAAPPPGPAVPSPRPGA
ncbi:GGDEF domain-containing protein [Pseudonocardia sp. TMWB2A]